jgi:hypothetical protein
VGRLFHGSETGNSNGNAVTEVENTEVEQTLSQECRNDIRSLARRWWQLVSEDSALGDAGKRLSPPELLLWMQAHDIAAPMAVAGGDSATEIILKADLTHLPRFLSRLESLLRRLQGSHSHSERGAAAPEGGLGPPAAITIARSTDGFAPIETIPYIESMVIEMLDRLYAPARLRSKRASSERSIRRGGKPRRAEMVTEGGLHVQYTAETATLTDLRDMVVQWLLPPD